MNKIKYFLFISLMIFGCSDNQEYTQVQLGEILEVKSQNFPGNNEGIIYAWGVPKSESGVIPIFEIENNIMIFTAEEVGKYTLSLSLETMGGEIIAEEIFYFDAVKTSQDSVADNNSTTNQNTDNENDADEKKHETLPQDNVDKEKEENIEEEKTIIERPLHPRPYFTVQVYSRPDYDMAFEDSSKLSHLGFGDIHLEKFNLNDTLFWRVRTGYFNTEIKANKHKNEISEVLQIDQKKLWEVEVK